MKPDAPAEYRGEFKPVRTVVPGIDICELLPMQAKIFDKIALLRSCVSIENDHYLAEVYSGLPRAAKRPAFGSIIARTLGNRGSMPAYVSMSRETTDIFEFENPLYVGSAYRAFRPFGQGLEDLAPPKHLAAGRLDDRRHLLQSFDTIRRDIDARGDMAGMDMFTRQALDIISSPAVRDAFDLSREPEKVRDRYGKKGAKYKYNKVDAAWDGDLFLRARRLVEAGARIVTIRPGSWDHHGGDAQGSIFDGYRTQLPLLDQSIHALITDLHDRGLDKDVAVVVLGEFGRTPRMNAGAGRDHWAEAGSVLFAGGGFKTGQVIGRTDSRAERPTDRPVGFQNIVATIYRFLGIDPGTTIPDHFGRPQYLLDEREPIGELG
jgi:hypothetical protein